MRRHCAYCLDPTRLARVPRKRNDGTVGDIGPTWCSQGCAMDEAAERFEGSDSLWCRKCGWNIGHDTEECGGDR